MMNESLVLYAVDFPLEKSNLHNNLANRENMNLLTSYLLKRVQIESIMNKCLHKIVQYGFFLFLFVWLQCDKITISLFLCAILEWKKKTKYWRLFLNKAFRQKANEYWKYLLNWIETKGWKFEGDTDLESESSRHHFVKL